MNMQEFAALKVGDTVEVLLAGGQSRGEVVEINDRGVRVKWGPKSYRGEVTFFYSANSTAWMHWGKIDAEVDSESGAATAPAVSDGAAE
jgi:hypothetical protein